MRIGSVGFCFTLLSMGAPTHTLGQAPPGAPATTKVESQDVAPAVQGQQYVFSLKGGHVAAVVSKGSRVAVAVDGVEGPRFDEILPIAGLGKGAQVVFSPDGNRHACLARSGQEYWP